MGFLISGLYFGFISGLGGKANKNDTGRNFDKARGLSRDYPQSRPERVTRME